MRRPSSRRPSSRRPSSRRLSDVSIRTELCEGPIPDSPPSQQLRPATPPEQQFSSIVSDRAELIERLKRGESPTWVPRSELESLLSRAKSSSPPQTPRPPASVSLGLLAAVRTTPENLDESSGPIDETPLQNGLDIERPRSALHSGNFTPEAPSLHARASQTDPVQQAQSSHFRSPSTSWIPSSPPRDFTPFNSIPRAAEHRKEAFNSGVSSVSSSLSSSFAYRPPTSPLVQSESNNDIDLSLPLNNFNIDTYSPRNPRRHSLSFVHSSLHTSSTSDGNATLRCEAAHLYQAHQPRRSMIVPPHLCFTGLPPQPTPASSQSRRPSLGSEASLWQHASMVGSYEESILRGRMSTTPSKPLDFMAQIGVLGIGFNCKPKLRCPSHVTIPFSAVFYSYASTSHGRSKVEDGPSPYVGQIDLENGLSNPDEGARHRRKLQTRNPERQAAEEEYAADVSDGEARKAVKLKRRSRSPKAPLGGRYRIPEKGQLQIIIKNQNKTAVKLFLVPYDLAGMEPGTKTFIRQRCYSAGPIIADIPKTSESDQADRPILRYLLHLHICCPSKGRYYLYKSIRVVFANRVPDGKEKLRNEITYPEPRFTPYKPTRTTHPNPGATLAAEQAFRRRSHGFSFVQQPPPFDLPPSLPMASTKFSFDDSRSNAPVKPVPFGLLTQTLKGGSSKDTAQEPSPGSSSQPVVAWPAAAAGDTMNGVEMTGPSGPVMLGTKYDKLSKGDVGYGGNAFSPPLTNGHPGVAEGLLSQRLRSLGMQGYLSDDSAYPGGD
ncbi:hypothetical protein B0T22DRAFT_380010 [Podospora appendiculata]|uniref:Atos-like conserved domain-containing protein n=1 Tax=Podospora appendiculata TaxID=314037 RepID=A0AAE0X9H5_9PEZI|nr:hypothetical protein B0T22DRAFT_380010 [Podospora appendiculata]